MPEHLAHHEEGISIRRREGSEGMAYVIEPKSGKPCPEAHPFPTLRQAGVMVGALA